MASLPLAMIIDGYPRSTTDVGRGAWVPNSEETILLKVALRMAVAVLSGVLASSPTRVPLRRTSA